MFSTLMLPQASSQLVSAEIITGLVSRGWHSGYGDATVIKWLVTWGFAAPGPPEVVAHSRLAVTACRGMARKGRELRGNCERSTISKSGAQVLDKIVG